MLNKSVTASVIPAPDVRGIYDYVSGTGNSATWMRTDNAYYIQYTGTYWIISIPGSYPALFTGTGSGLSPTGNGTYNPTSPHTGNPVVADYAAAVTRQSALIGVVSIAV